MDFMMIGTRIRQVKKEIRVLGIAVKPSIREEQFHAVGVVFRGGLWLDGVMKTTAQGPDITDKLAEMITESTHHPQIRVILLHEALIEGEATVDPFRLSIGTTKPVIVVSSDGKHPKVAQASGELAVFRFTCERGDESIDVLSIGLRSSNATRILEMSTREGVMPEALRVASLIVSAVAAGFKQNI